MSLDCPTAKRQPGAPSASDFLLDNVRNRPKEGASNCLSSITLRTDPATRDQSRSEWNILADRRKSLDDLFGSIQGYGNAVRPNHLRQRAPGADQGRNASSKRLCHW